MKKLLILTLMLVLTSCTFEGNQAPQGAKMEQNNMQVANFAGETIDETDATETQTETAVDTRMEQVNESGWYVYDIKDVEVSVTDEELLNVTEVRVNPEYQSVWVFYKGNDENRIDISAVPTGAKFADEFGNVRNAGSYGARDASASPLDLTSKTYTIELEFDDNPEVGDVTITITLP